MDKNLDIIIKILSAIFLVVLAFLGYQSSLEKNENKNILEEQKTQKEIQKKSQDLKYTEDKKILSEEEKYYDKKIEKKEEENPEKIEKISDEIIENNFLLKEKEIIEKIIQEEKESGDKDFLLDWKKEESFFFSPDFKKVAYYSHCESGMCALNIKDIEKNLKTIKFFNLPGKNEAGEFVYGSRTEMIKFLDWISENQFSYEILSMENGWQKEKKVYNIDN